LFANRTEPNRPTQNLYIQLKRAGSSYRQAGTTLNTRPPHRAVAACRSCRWLQLARRLAHSRPFNRL